MHLGPILSNILTFVICSLAFKLVCLVLSDTSTLLLYLWGKAKSLMFEGRFNQACVRHDQNPRFSKSLSRLKIFYTRLTPVISRLLTVNTMLQTC